MQRLTRFGASRILVGVLAAMVFASSGARAQPVETEIPDVTTELVELRQQAGVLRLAVRLVNTSERDAAAGTIQLSQLVLIDAKTKAKHFALKSADGNFIGGPTSEWGAGGVWFVKVPAKRQVILWALFEPLPAGSTVSVQVPLMFPCDDVKVSEGGGTLLSSTAASSEISGIAATLASARRADRQLNVRVRLAVGEYGKDTFRYKDVYFFDPLTKRKYRAPPDPSSESPNSHLTMCAPPTGCDANYDDCREHPERYAEVPFSGSLSWYDQRVRNLKFTDTASVFSHQLAWGVGCGCGTRPPQAPAPFGSRTP